MNKWTSKEKNPMICIHVWVASLCKLSVYDAMQWHSEWEKRRSYHRFCSFFLIAAAVVEDNLFECVIFFTIPWTCCAYKTFEKIPSKKRDVNRWRRRKNNHYKHHIDKEVKKVVGTRIAHRFVPKLLYVSKIRSGDDASWFSSISYRKGRKNAETDMQMSKLEKRRRRRKMEKKKKKTKWGEWERRSSISSAVKCTHIHNAKHTG